MALIHTCYRITDIDRSVAFYEALGFQEIGRLPIKDEAVNVFMNQPGDGDMPRLELTHNFGVDPMRSAPATATSRSPPTTSTARWRSSPSRASSPEKPPYSVREGGSRLCFVQGPRRIPSESRSRPRETRPAAVTLPAAPAATRACARSSTGRGLRHRAKGEP